MTTPTEDATISDFPINENGQNFKELDNHIKEKIVLENNRKCEFCHVSFPSLFHYYKHLIKCRSLNGIFCKRCRYCRYQFYCVSSFSRHMFMCLKSKKELFRLKKTRIQKYVHLTESYNDRHVEEQNISSNEWKYCSKCESTFRIPLHYQMHLKRKGWCRPKPYVCRDCGKTFRNVHHLISHENRKTSCKFSSRITSSIRARKKTYGLKKKHPNQKLHIDKILKEEEVMDHNNVLSDISSEINDLMSKDYSVPKHVINLKTDISQAESKKEFCCKRCGMCFKTRQFYFRHLMRTTPCNINMNNKHYQKQNEHFNITLEEKLDISPVKTIEKSEHELSYECRICHKKFQFPSQIKDHLSSSPECTIISEKTFSHEKDLNKVKQTARKSLPSSYFEPKIDISFVNKDIKNSENSFEFHLLGNSSKNYHNLIKTEYEEAEETVLWNKICNLTCEICDKECSSLISLKRHMKKHPSHKKAKYALKCPVCLQVFYSQFLLLCHQKKSKHWGKATKSRTIECNCPFCDKKFLYVRSRNTHVRNHLREKPCEVEAFLQQTTCDICFQPFASQAVKLQHLKISHLSKRNSSTEVSDMYAGQVSETPEEIRELVPESSLNIYASESNTNLKLKKKERKTVIITADILALLRKYPNTCPVCKKKYCSTFVRNRHFKTHTMDKTFSCKWCSEKFFRSDRLTHHMQRVHNDLLIFECQGCGLRFPTKMHVIQHISKSHSDQVRDSLVIERDIDSALPSVNKDLPKQKESLKFDHFKEHGLSKVNKNCRKRKFCELCNTGFTKTAHLLRHQLSKMHKDNLFLHQVRNSDFLSVNSPEMSSPPCNPTSPVPSGILPPSRVVQSKQKSAFLCSVCREPFVSVTSFVPHRLGHFNFKSMDPSEISDINPYHCEICAVKLDHHQRVQVHLLWHLQSDIPIETASYKQCSNKDQQCLKTEEETLLKYESKPPIQVAKKSSGNSSKSAGKLSKKPQFFCDACHMGFTTKHHHSAHVRRYCQVRRAEIHSTKESSSPLITKSLRSVSPKSILQCRYCFLELFSVSDLKWHEKSCRKVQDSERTNDKDSFNSFYSCEYCKCVFFSFENFNQHKSFFCSNKAIDEYPIKPTSLDLKIICKLKEIKKSDSYAACLQCYGTFTDANSLVEHMNICIPNYNGDKFAAKSHTSPCVKELENESVNNSNLVTGLENNSVKPVIKDNCSDNLKNKQHCKLNIVKEKSSLMEINNTDGNLDLLTPLMSDVTGIQIKTENDVHKKTLMVGPVKTEVTNELILNDAKEIKNGKIKIENIETIEEGSLAEQLSLNKLRDSFSQLLYLLVADPELMQQLGWGQRLIDNVLEDVLHHMGQHPVENGSNIEIDRLRSNILLLLQLCIKDQLMDEAAEGKRIDDVVLEVLKMCLAGMETQESSVD